MDRIFIADGSVWTSAGMTAGIDMALGLVERDLGRDVAHSTAKMMVVHHRRAGRQSQHSAMFELDAKSDRVQNALAFARKNVRQPSTVEQLADGARLSPRLFIPIVVDFDSWQESQARRKQFFFEKKNQKTFTRWFPRPTRPARTAQNKNFLVLFFKKELLPCWPNGQSPSRLVLPGCFAQKPVSHLVTCPRSRESSSGGRSIYAPAGTAAGRGYRRGNRL
jgi:hypothetical protein